MQLCVNSQSHHANRYLWAHGSFVLCPNKANKASAQCAWRSERRKEANRPSSISGTDVGMYANEPLSGSKSKPLGAANRLFPMVTVTNESQNRSTLNFCNFAVPWRIELNFFALESWRDPPFNSIIFIGKGWGLKNHPWSWGHCGYCRFHLTLPFREASPWTMAARSPKIETLIREIVWWKI